MLGNCLHGGGSLCDAAHSGSVACVLPCHLSGLLTCIYPVLLGVVLLQSIEAVVHSLWKSNQCGKQHGLWAFQGTRDCIDDILMLLMEHLETSLQRQTICRAQAQAQYCSHASSVAVHVATPTVNVFATPGKPAPPVLLRT